jgi:hypothetical protein
MMGFTPRMFDLSDLDIADDGSVVLGDLLLVEIESKYGIRSAGTSGVVATNTLCGCPQNFGPCTNFALCGANVSEACRIR